MNIYANLFFTFMKIGVFTFGGGYAMIPLIDRECSEKRDWITSDELSEVTAVAESTPGPIAINCATFIGNRKAGFLGASLATLGVILPSFVIILIISGFMENLLNNTFFANAFKGIRIAVSLLILRAGIKMLKGCLKKSGKKTVSAIIALIFFSAVTLLNILGINFSSIYLILISGVAGFWLDEEMFANIIAISESTPGPIMVNTATYIGNVKGGLLGAALATLGVVLPSFIIIIVISIYLKKFLKNKHAKAAMLGVQPCISGMIIATGGFMAFTMVFGSVSVLGFDASSFIIFAVLTAIVMVYKKLTQKEISPIVLIVISAVLGIAVFGAFK